MWQLRLLWLIYFIYPNSSMKHLFWTIGKQTRNVSTRWSLFAVFLSHACCLPALAGLAGFSLSTIQFIGPQFHLIIKIIFGITVILQLSSLIYRIIHKQLTWRYGIFYTALFASLGTMIYSISSYVHPTWILVSMWVLFTTSIIDIFVKNRDAKARCCK